MKHKKNQNKKGQAALSLIFLIGGMALLVSITLSLVAINFLNSTFSFQSANKAMALAVAGVEDALLQLDRNTAFNPGTYTVPSSCASGCATVIITQGTNTVTIVSTATVFASQRKIQAVASINPSDGSVSASSWSMIIL